MEITFNPSKKQFKAWEYLTDNITTEIGYGGAASGGKSYLGCFWILSMCLTYPDTGWLIGRKELTNLKRTTLITFFKVCSEYGIEPEKHFTYNQNNNVITFKNGSQIFLMDLGYKPSDPLFTRLGGLEITGYFIDEANETPQEAINIIKTRTGRRNNKTYNLKPKGLETFNPDKGHVYTRYYKPYKDNSLPEHRKFIPALPQDNPHTTEDYLNQLRNSDKVTRERLLEGNFDYDDDPNNLFETDAVNDLFTNTVNNGEMYISADIARLGSDSTVIGVFRGLHCIKIEEYNGKGIDYTCERIRALSKEYKVPFSHVIADEDGLGGGVVDILKGIKGFIANTSPFDIWDTHSHKKRPANFKNLKHQCYFKLAEVVNGHKMAITVDKDSMRERITEELSAIKNKPNTDSKAQINSKDDQKLLIGRSPDVADMLMMRMYFEFTSAKELDVRAMVHNVYRTRMNNMSENSY